MRQIVQAFGKIEHFLTNFFTKKSKEEKEREEEEKKREKRGKEKRQKIIINVD